MRLLLLPAVLAGLALVPETSRADLMFFTSFGDFQSTPGSDVDNILLQMEKRGQEYFDETTMDALDAALGRALVYSVVTPATMIRRQTKDGPVHRVENEPWWTPLIRAASGLHDNAEKKEED